jgi:hypothetical protein
LETAYHPGVGVDNLAVRTAPTLLKNSNLQWSDILDTIRQNSIDYSDNLTYTGFRTIVRYRYHERGLNLYDKE